MSANETELNLESTSQSLINKSIENLSGAENKKKHWSSNIELFRIITMLLIVTHHYVVNYGLTDVAGLVYSKPLLFRSLFLLLFGIWGKTGIALCGRCDLKEMFL